MHVVSATSNLCPKKAKRGLSQAFSKVDKFNKGGRHERHSKMTCVGKKSEEKSLRTKNNQAKT